GCAAGRSLDVARGNADGVESDGDRAQSFSATVQRRHDLVALLLKRSERLALLLKPYLSIGDAGPLQGRDGLARLSHALAELRKLLRPGDALVAAEELLSRPGSEAKS